MSEYSLLTKLYGVRGSFPISPKEGTKYGGNTTCLSARTPNHVLVIDAGSGIAQAGNDLLPEILAHKEKSRDPFYITMMFSHTHIDHLIGFPFFAPLYIPGVHLTLVGPATLGVDFEDILSTFVEPQYFPVSMDEFRCTKSFENIHENMIVYFTEDSREPHFATIGEVLPANVCMSVSNIKYYFHPKDGNFIYKINWGERSLVFATDVEQYVGSDQRLLTHAEGCDILIHDAQYTLEQYLKFQGFGHSTYEMACEAAIKAKAKKLLLFHHAPNNDDAVLEDIEKKAKEKFPNSELAYEGWEWRL
jgi:ribonuclease BN (tRNA processing enzyme)